MTGPRAPAAGPRRTEDAATAAFSILPAGDRALLVTLPDHRAPASIAAALRRRMPTGVQDVLPAARTVLLTLTAAADPRGVRRELLALLARAQADTAGSGAIEQPAVTIPVRYDGADLVDVAAALAITVEEVIARHTENLWRCAFIGFAPGFGYLEATGAELTVPRRAQSRTAIPAGAVALADGYSAVYPRRSPGGWQIIGRTDAQMWDPARAEPALLEPGRLVRFVAEGQPVAEAPL